MNNKRVDIKQVAAAAQNMADTLVPEWLRDGKRESHEWVALNPTRHDGKAGSFKVNLVTGAWSDFACGENRGGDLVSLYRYLFGFQSQVEAAKAVGISPYWLAAANTAGATAGKMISPQSIAVATAATGIIGSEGKILQATLKVCIVYVVVIGVVVYFGAPLVSGLLATLG